MIRETVAVRVRHIGVGPKPGFGEVIEQVAVAVFRRVRTVGRIEVEKV